MRDLEDAMFWERLHDMPAWEAEQECVMRREELALQNAELLTQRSKMNPPIGLKQKELYAALGAEMQENSSRLVRLNERIKYLRKLQHRIQWKEAVRALFGDDAVEQCVIYMEQRWPECHPTTKES